MNKVFVKTIERYGIGRGSSRTLDFGGLSRMINLMRFDSYGERF